MWSYSSSGMCLVLHCYYMDWSFPICFLCHQLEGLKVSEKTVRWVQWPHLFMLLNLVGDSATLLDLQLFKLLPTLLSHVTGCCISFILMHAEINPTTWRKVRKPKPTDKIFNKKVLRCGSLLVHENFVKVPYIRISSGINKTVSCLSGIAPVVWI